MRIACASQRSQARLGLFLLLALPQLAPSQYARCVHAWHLACFGSCLARVALNSAALQANAWRLASASTAGTAANAPESAPSRGGGRRAHPRAEQEPARAICVYGGRKRTGWSSSG